jgi:hypothetical protein
MRISCCNLHIVCELKITKCRNSRHSSLFLLANKDARRIPYWGDSQFGTFFLLQQDQKVLSSGSAHLKFKIMKIYFQSPYGQLKH